MAREGYQAKLGELQEDVLYMSELVLERLRTGLSALEEKDDELAWEVIEGDGEINQLYLDLESDCIDLLSLQQPVAGDLRFIAASFKIITDLERIGDLATNLGEYTLDAEQDRYPDVDIQAIGDAVIEMVEDAMGAYDDEDADRTFEVAERDDEIDELCERASTVVVRDLIETEIEADSDDAEIEALMADVSRFLLTVRDLERVGDHAVNIAGRTLYMVESDDELIY
ncbi:phosphate signaling complex protein PhoU [Halosegnis rubeus]|jgi:phosphate transport system protein|uniref:Phosphate-specific transport system accessory protein PhoU n=1 Tax=Halosegnis rubeus TaxID=2212850 RepID=A0A5N5UF21_9EURY|nr:phosphate signaling complex protein PhoU [Halosegnis rubeus]KAB7515715.1 phosphate signaling complex protein PhoU [Halosegnis rubeus]KAB7517070.1 phosphate signaling complex protein PhoU [Halosegnis rubeus]KAB7519802.1 phosphate signaling complex protein PhoU [Halosegnis rubeus]